MTKVMLSSARRREGGWGRWSIAPVVRWIKVKFTLEHAMKAQRGSRGIAVLFL
jgi:hypothetical protein